MTKTSTQCYNEGITEKNNDKNKHTKTILHATMKVLLRKIMTKINTKTILHAPMKVLLRKIMTKINTQFFFCMLQ